MSNLPESPAAPAHIGNDHPPHNWTAGEESELRAALAEYPPERATPATPITCQIYGHVVGHCGECNVADEAAADVNETNAVLASRYIALTCATPAASDTETAELRASFERWYSDGNKSPRAIERNGSGYLLMQAGEAWRVWQACSNHASLLATIAALRVRVAELERASDLAIELQNMAQSDAEASDRARIAQSAPAGYVLVPVDLTEDMIVAFAEVWYSKVRCIDDCEMEDCYAAMLAAAPTPPAQPAPSDIAYPYARDLAIAIWQRCYSIDAPQWKLLPDMVGVISQIDNMVSGMEKAAQPAPDLSAPSMRGDGVSARDAALAEAAALFPQPYMEYFGQDIQDRIMALQSAPAAPSDARDAGGAK